MNIEKIELNAQDVLVITLNVGNMPPFKVREYLDKVTGDLKKIFTNHVMVLPGDADHKGVSITIISRPQQ